MQVTPSEKIAQKPVDMEGSQGCHVRILVGKEQSAPNFVMREFTVEPGGHTPKHFHDYEHEVFVLSGSGKILDNDQWRELAQGDVVYVAPNDVHQFKNDSDDPLKFLCLIPNSALDKAITTVGESAVPECGLE